MKPSQPAAPTSDQTETLTLLRRHRMERPPHGAPPPTARLALQPWIPSRESLLQPGAEVPRCRGDLKTGQVRGALNSEDHKTTGVGKCADLSLPPPLHCVGNPGPGWNYNSRQAPRQGPSGQPEWGTSRTGVAAVVRHAWSGTRGKRRLIAWQVQWLRLLAANAGGAGSIRGGGSKTTHVPWRARKKLWNADLPPP